jgi:hypothetical protein
MNARLIKISFLITSALIAFGLFYLNGVGEMSPHSDGGSHYITGLLAYDWIQFGHFKNPIEFGTEYFKHFPYIGLLLWPPFFHFLEMIAFSVLGPTAHTSLVLVTCIFVASGAWLGYAVWKSGRASLTAHAAIAALLTSVLIQDTQQNVLIDGLVAFLSFAAALAFSSYVIRPTLGSAFGVGVLAVLAFYSKGNAMQLAFILPLIAIFMRRPQVLIIRTTLLLAAACIVITGPWLYMTAGLSGQGALYTPGILTFLKLVKDNSTTLFWAAPLLTPFSVIGASAVIYQFVTAKGKSRALGAFEATCFATMIGSLCFHSLLAIGDDARYMLTALFGVVGLSVLGTEVVIGFVSKLTSRPMTNTVATSLLATLLAGQTMINILTPKTPMPNSAGIVAQAIMSAMPEENRSVMIVGNHNLETSIGPALAELEGNKRLTETGVVIVRASRALIGGGYRNRDYLAKFDTDEQYQKEILRLGTPVIVLGSSQKTDSWPYIAAIERIMNSKTSNYVKISEMRFFQGQTATVWKLKPELVKPINFDVVSESNKLRDRVTKVTAGTPEVKKN